jgi:hypothetical protein
VVDGEHNHQHTITAHNYTAVTVRRRMCKCVPHVRVRTHTCLQTVPYYYQFMPYTWNATTNTFSVVPSLVSGGTLYGVAPGWAVVIDGIMSAVNTLSTSVWEIDLHCGPDRERYNLNAGAIPLHVQFRPYAINATGNSVGMCVARVRAQMYSVRGAQHIPQRRMGPERGVVDWHA